CAPGARRLMSLPRTSCPGSLEACARCAIIAGDEARKVPPHGEHGRRRSLPGHGGLVLELRPGGRGGGPRRRRVTSPVRGGGARGASVLQHHRSASRDGLYVEPVLTRAAVAALHRDPTFNASIQGPTFAQLLYVDGGTGGRDAVIAATEQNLVYALDASNGAVMWQQQLAPPAALGGSGICGDVDPIGITGTPVIDPQSRTLYVAAMSAGGSAGRRH